MNSITLKKTQKILPALFLLASFVVAVVPTCWAVNESDLPDLIKENFSLEARHDYSLTEILSLVKPKDTVGKVHPVYVTRDKKIQFIFQDFLKDFLEVRNFNFNFFDEIYGFKGEQKITEKLKSFIASKKNSVTGQRRLDLEKVMEKNSAAPLKDWDHPFLFFSLPVDSCSLHDLRLRDDPFYWLFQKRNPFYELDFLSCEIDKPLLLVYYKSSLLSYSSENGRFAEAPAIGWADFMEDQSSERISAIVAEDYSKAFFPTSIMRFNIKIPGAYLIRKLRADTEFRAEWEAAQDLKRAFMQGTTQIQLEQLATAFTKSTQNEIRERQGAEHETALIEARRKNELADLVRQQEVKAAQLRERELDVNRRSRLNELAAKGQILTRTLFSPKVLGSTSLLMAAYHLLKNGTPALFKVRPQVISESSLPKYSWQRFFSRPKNESRLNEMVYNQELHRRIMDLSRRNKQIVASGGLLSNLLFYGPPGVGKTMAAKEIARHSGANYLIFSGADFMQLPLEEALQELKGIFRYARSSRKPVVVFVDEADSMFPHRSKASEINKKLTNLFLAMVEKPSDAHLQFIFATNAALDLDFAVLSRINPLGTVKFSAPDQKAREHLLMVYLEKLLTRIPRSQLTLNGPAFAEAFERRASQLAAVLEGWVGRGIEQLVIDVVGQWQLDQQMKVLAAKKGASPSSRLASELKPTQAQFERELYGVFLRKIKEGQENALAFQAHEENTASPPASSSGEVTTVSVAELLAQQMEALRLEEHQQLAAADAESTFAGEKTLDPLKHSPTEENRQEKLTLSDWEEDGEAGDDADSLGEESEVDPAEDRRPAQ